RSTACPPKKPPSRPTSSGNAAVLAGLQTVKKVPSSRHVRMDGTHTGKLSAESVRGRKAECAVQRSSLSPGTAKPRRVERTKQPKRSRGSGLPFASPLRRAQQKQGTATTRGKEFLSCAAGRNGFPLERGAFATRCAALTTPPPLCYRVRETTKGDMLCSMMRPPWRG